MLDRVQNSLKNNIKLKPEAPILVGVSGGYDSICLLHILHKLKYPLIAAYFNHGLRIEAKDEELLVEKLADNLGIKFVSSGQSVKSFAEEHHKSIEEAARILRYRFLFEQAELWKAQAVAVGHNADDQVETVLMHLIQGTGLDGLLGMQTLTLPNSWSEKISLVRPLLSTWRHDIIKYCNHFMLHPVNDSSNKDEKYLRNRLRHNLIPILENYVPNTQERIWHMSATLKGDHDIVTEVLNRSWEKCLIEQQPRYIVFDREKLFNQSIGVQRRLIRMAVKTMRVNIRNLDYDAVERATMFIQDSLQSKQTDYCLGLRLVLENDKFYIADWEADLPFSSWPQLMGENLKMPIPGTLAISSEWKFVARLVEDIEIAKKVYLENRNPFQVWMFLDRRKSCITLRSRQPGDRITPLGLNGKTVKISDLMINKKIPRRARAAWPLLCIDEEIVWVPGYQLGEFVKLSPTTKIAVHLELVRGSNFDIGDEEE